MPFKTLTPGTMLCPVPAVMVSCASETERPNIITVAWAGTVCSQPPMLSVAVRGERFSHHIIRDSGEFVVKLGKFFSFNRVEHYLDLSLFAFMLAAFESSLKSGFFAG